MLKCEIEPAFERIRAAGAEGMIVLPDALVMRQRRKIIEFAALQRSPVISGRSEFARSGGTMTYGPNLKAVFQRLAIYVDKIPKGAESGRVGRRATDQIRAGDQPQDRQRARPRRAADLSQFNEFYTRAYECQRLADRYPVSKQKYESLAHEWRELARQCCRIYPPVPLQIHRANSATATVMIAYASENAACLTISSHGGLSTRRDRKYARHGAQHRGYGPSQPRM